MARLPVSIKVSLSLLQAVKWFVVVNPWESTYPGECWVCVAQITVLCSLCACFTESPMCHVTVGSVPRSLTLSTPHPLTALKPNVRCVHVVCSIKTRSKSFGPQQSSPFRQRTKRALVAETLMQTASSPETPMHCGVWQHIQSVVFIVTGLRAAGWDVSLCVQRFTYVASS